MTEVSPELRAALNRMVQMHVSREPRWRYFGARGGPMFFWTVEKYDEDAHWSKVAGRYVSGVYKPIGKGARSGAATRFELVESKCTGHKTRKAAKARALRLYKQSQGTS